VGALLVRVNDVALDTAEGRQGAARAMEESTTVRLLFKLGMSIADEGAIAKMQQLHDVPDNQQPRREVVVSLGRQHFEN
jgi:hypothetical protein